MTDDRLVKTVEISVFAHATEDEEKVKQAVKQLTPNEAIFETQKLTGHYDDPITLISISIAKKKEATELLQKIYNRLSSLDRQTILDSLENRIDPTGNLYLRLDKQRAYNGKFTLHENDPIRIKFKLQIPHGADQVTTIREYLLNISEEEETAEQ